MISEPKGMSNGRAVNGFLLDITGVLYNSIYKSDGVAIAKSAEAVDFLYQHSKVKFLSNAKGNSNRNVARRLQRLGINVREEDVITPAPVVAQYCRENKLRPHLFVRDDVLEYFDGIDTSSPNCVVMGEVEEGFSFDRINRAFRILIDMPKPLLITMGNGKFFQRVDGPCIDVGAFAAALKFSTNCEVLNIGKPSRFYFEQGMNALGMKPEEIVMVGDDLMSDVGGAQACGMRGIQVRTGKWRPDFEKMPVTPDLTADCLYDAVKLIADNGFRL
ncbi:hypothetical protein GCK72_018192 [Caenorhabditis remanei]|uniref:Phospholysine phosphohistidine inorganic pyrophosphate phosphatase n=2 Tax=Caenorhabditis remanei TaxID=31234 RepID=A0A2P4VH71_CAERE|nr:hypothetical protein GCK72_018192 [Caenorhabditis remanei]KAF1751638.1 hypothetical protein GCK72_018192 [Caenorhabditis remanei]